MNCWWAVLLKDAEVNVNYGRVSLGVGSNPSQDDHLALAHQIRRQRPAQGKSRKEKQRHINEFFHQKSFCFNLLLFPLLLAKDAWCCDCPWESGRGVTPLPLPTLHFFFHFYITSCAPIFSPFPFFHQTVQNPKSDCTTCSLLFTLAHQQDSNPIRGNV